MEAGHRRLTLADQISLINATNLRDLLRIREEDDRGRETLAGLTLGAILSCESTRTPPIQTSRTLIDIINDEESSAQNNKKSWKSLKDLLRHRVQISRPFLAGPSNRNSEPIITNSDSISAANVEEILEPEPEPEPDSDSGVATAENLVEPVVMRLSLSAALAAEPDGSSSSLNSISSTTAAEVVEPMRVSLMALLEETDRSQERVVVGPTLVETEDGEDRNNGVGVGGRRKEEYVCCVCMVRHKGAAFVPCGHTFCRICSRELWVSRKNCPLCNGFILQILDIF